MGSRHCLKRAPPSPERGHSKPWVESAPATEADTRVSDIGPLATDLAAKSPQMRPLPSIFCFSAVQVSRTCSVNNVQSSIRLKIFLASSR